MNIRFFKTPVAFRKWLNDNFDKCSELYVGFHKKASARPSITYHEAVDEALCFGWIDGVRRRVDEVSYTVRFTPRKPKSVWSLINARRARKLKTEGRMKPAGLTAYSLRDNNRTGIYSFENRPRKLDGVYEKRLRANNEAWSFFVTAPPYYKRIAAHWIMSAKREETRLRRLERLIAACAKGLRLDELMGQAKGKASHHNVRVPGNANR